MSRRDNAAEELVEFRCSCCGNLSTRKEGASEGGLPIDSRYCDECRRHVGYQQKKVDAREVSHRRMWLEEMEALKAAWGEAVAGLENRIAVLEHELADRPVEVVEKNLDQEVVEEAERSKWRTQDHIDGLYSVMSYVRALHRRSTDGSGRCWCGLAVKDCKTRTELDGVRGLDGWDERHLADYKYDPYRNSPLHEFHPARFDPSWQTGDGVDLQRWR